MAYVETKTGGWLWQAEDRKGLAEMAVRMTYGSLDDAPEEFDPGTDWFKIEMQANQGACQGNSASSCDEWLNVEVGGNHVELSRACAYYESQRLDGIRGDRGSTISGGVKLMQRVGIVTEADWPYPNRYSPRRPSGFDDMIKYKIGHNTPLNGYEVLMKHLRSKLPAHTGFMWSSVIDRQVGNDGLLRQYGRGGGGHSVFFLGYRVTDWNGAPLPTNYGSGAWPILWNSWDVRWGHGGRCLVSPKACDNIIGSRWAEFQGLYGAPTPGAVTPTVPEL